MRQCLLLACLLGLVACSTAPQQGSTRPSSAAQRAAATPTLPAPTPIVLPDSFAATFDGEPGSPQPWQPSGWDVTVHSRGRSTLRTLDPMQAAHGADCGAPPATHTVDSYQGAVYSCRNHLMTAINGADYGAIYLTPNALATFAQGETVIRFDMSTLRSSDRDWVDLWVTPFADNLQFPLEEWLPDLQGPPRRAVHIRMYLTGPSNNLTAFAAAVVRDFTYEKLPTTGDWRGYEQVLTPDAARRDTFELRLSRTHITFGMPQYNYWWVDTRIADLGWDEGVVQLGHHSYNPNKCDDCAPNTWHWDNVSIAPARPFTMIPGDLKLATGDVPGRVRFAQPAPEGAYLRFAGSGAQLEVSFDNGASWQPAQRQVQQYNHTDHASSFWTPVPAGIQSVLLRGEQSWAVRDIAIWAEAP